MRDPSVRPTLRPVGVPPGEAAVSEIVGALLLVVIVSSAAFGLGVFLHQQAKLTEAQKAAELQKQLEKLEVLSTAPQDIGATDDWDRVDFTLSSLHLDASHVTLVRLNGFTVEGAILDPLGTGQPLSFDPTDPYSGELAIPARSQVTVRLGDYLPGTTVATGDDDTARAFAGSAAADRGDIESFRDLAPGGWSDDDTLYLSAAALGGGARGASVATADVRVTAAGAYHGGAPVRAGQPDLGAAVTASAPLAATCYIDADASATYSLGDPVFLAQSCAALAVDDLRLTTTTSKQAFTRLATGDAEVGATAMALASARWRFVDVVGGASSFEAGDAIYLDVDGLGGAVAAGDVRLTSAHGMANGASFFAGTFPILASDSLELEVVTRLGNSIERAFQPPTAVIVLDQRGGATTSYILHGGSSDTANLDGFITLYAWSVDVTDGNGGDPGGCTTAVDQPATGRVAQATMIDASPCDVVVDLTVTDNFGMKGKATFSFSV